MARIFVSHSRRDRDIVNFFTEAFATSKKGVKADFMEFENMEGKDAGREIIQKIKDLETQAVFVLLGPGVLKFRHTENWIAFEVGVCSGVEKDVWVFEPIRETVEFPIPYLNHYVPYRVGDKEEFAFLRHMIDVYDATKDLRTSLISHYKFKSVQCPHCNAEYSLYSSVGGFPCPRCKRFEFESLSLRRRVRLRWEEAMWELGNRLHRF